MNASGRQENVGTRIAYKGSTRKKEKTSENVEETRTVSKPTKKGEKKKEEETGKKTKNKEEQQKNRRNRGTKTFMKEQRKKVDKVTREKTERKKRSKTSCCKGVREKKTKNVVQRSVKSCLESCPFSVRGAAGSHGGGRHLPPSPKGVTRAAARTALFKTLPVRSCRDGLELFGSIRLPFCEQSFEQSVSLPPRE